MSAFITAPMSLGPFAPEAETAFCTSDCSPHRRAAGQERLENADIGVSLSGELRPAARLVLGSGSRARA